MAGINWNRDRINHQMRGPTTSIKSNTPIPLKHQAIKVGKGLSDRVNKLLGKQQLTGWEREFLSSILDYEHISQKQADTISRIDSRINPNYSPEEQEQRKQLKEQISAALKRKAEEKNQPDLSDIPFDPPYIIRKRR